MKSEIIEQFEKQFYSLDTLYSKVSEAAWLGGEGMKDWGVWRWMYHMVETIDFYLSEQQPGVFKFGSRFGVDWESEQPERVPTPEEMKAYQDEIRQRLVEVLAGKSEEDFKAAEEIYPWTGANYAGRCLYMLRHSQQHIGDVNCVLRMYGCETVEWR